MSQTTNLICLQRLQYTWNPKCPDAYINNMLCSHMNSIPKSSSNDGHDRQSPRRGGLGYGCVLARLSTVMIVCNIAPRHGSHRGSRPPRRGICGLSDIIAKCRPLRSIGKFIMPTRRGMELTYKQRSSRRNLC